MNEIIVDKEIDWVKVHSVYKKLGVPEKYYNPFKNIPFESVRWNVLESIRSASKTTNMMLLGLCVHKIYKHPVIYMRQYDTMLVPMKMKELCNVIIFNGYVEKLTDGRWNSLIYRARRWYYATKDKDGNVLEIDPEACIVCVAVNENFDYKSSLNIPECSIVIFDEFVSNRYMKDEFVLLCDLLSTLRRSKKNFWIFMLANTINAHAMYFQELGISQKIKHIHKGEHAILHSGYVPIYCEYIHVKNQDEVADSNLTFFGFENPKLASITGSQDWAVAQYDHLPVAWSDSKIEKYERFHIKFDSLYVRGTCCTHPELGCFIFFNSELEPKFNNERIFTQDRVETMFESKIFSSSFDKIIWQLMQEGHCYYATNETGELVNQFIKTAFLRK